MSPISLGYVTDCKDPHLLHRRYFPSKVGGKPAWLDPINLPNGDQVLRCHRPGCSKQPLTFILQVYSGRDSPEDAFHRTIFIFGCQWCSETFVALRCQLPRENQYYLPVPADIKDGNMKDECLEERCCSGCGIPTQKRTTPRVEEVQSENENLEMPSLSRQLPEMHHRCKMAVEWVDRQIPVIFNEGELEIDDENLDPKLVEDADFSHELSLLERYKIEEIADPENVLDESEQEAFNDIHRERCHEDSTFSHFLERIRLNPGHVIRYHLNDGDDNINATPLWFSSYQLPSKQQLEKQIGKCGNCGGHRQFEFQIQPNIINELGGGCRLSFGILAIFTCVKSCSSKLNEESNLYGAYISECVIRQEEKFQTNGNCSHSTSVSLETPTS